MKQKKSLTGTVSSSNLETTAERISTWFSVTKQEARKWAINESTLEHILNLNPSEDAVIVHFLVPLLKNFLQYDTTDIDIKPILTLNKGNYLEKYGGQSDVLVRKSGKPVFIFEAKSYGEKLIS